MTCFVEAVQFPRLVRQRRQRGAIGGIPDAVMAIAIGAVVVVLIIALGYKGWSSSRTTIEMANLQTLTSGTKELYSGNGAAYSGNLNSVLIAAKKAPQSSVVGTDTMTNQWGGTITVSGTGTVFTVAYTLVPKDACIELIPKTPSEGYTQVATSGSTMTTLPISVAEAVTACSQQNNTITWTAQ